MDFKWGLKRFAYFSFDPEVIETYYQKRSTLKQSLSSVPQVMINRNELWLKRNDSFYYLKEYIGPKQPLGFCDTIDLNPQKYQVRGESEDAEKILDSLSDPSRYSITFYKNFAKSEAGELKLVFQEIFFADDPFSCLSASVGPR